LSKYERWNALLELLAARGRLDVEDAATELAVSAATIRRDFDELAQQQMLTRTRGGAVAHQVSYDLPLRYKTARNAGAKSRIGAAAAALVQPGATVGLNGGTTTTEVARALATRADLHGDGTNPAVTVVTNALNIAAELTVRQHVKIVVTGGVARPQSYELIGPLAAGVLDGLALDIAFLGVDGIDPVEGATAQHEGEAAINQLMARRSRRVVVVADSSKLGHNTFARICPLGEVDTIVTDSRAEPGTVAAFTEAGLRVIAV
jgi:DeoR family transcriptional regulator of aga operon